MMIGLLLIAAAFFLTLYNVWDGNRADQAAQKVVASLEKQIGEGLPMESYRAMPAVELDGNLYIGTLEVPALDLTLPVMAKWDYNKLKISPCCYYGSYYEDNLVIAGHNYARHFSPLKWLPEGSEINFTDVLGNTYHYTIGWVETLSPDATEQMITGDWDLTLFTCTTGGGARCTIRCIREM